MELKSIIGFEKYSVTDTGLILNTKTGKYLKLTINKDGYCHVKIIPKSRLPKRPIGRPPKTKK